MRYAVFIGKEDSAWTITETAGSDSSLLADGKRCRGTTHYFKREIYVDKDLSPEDKKQVLIHELAHATLYDTQIELKEEYSEENMCDFMAMYGSGIIRVAEDYLKKRARDENGNC